MNTKLTLTIDQTVIDKAKRYAKKRGNSLSGIIENYLKVITNDNPESENKDYSHCKINERVF